MAVGTTSSPIPLQVGVVSEIATLATPVLVWPLAVMRGDSLDLVFRAYREVYTCDGDIVGSGSGTQILTGLEARATVRRAKDHPIPYPLTVTVDQTGAGSTTRGIIRVTADASVTRMLPDHGVWDLELSDGTDTLRKTLVTGVLQLQRDTSI